MFQNINNTRELNIKQIELIISQIENKVGIDKNEIIFNSISSVLKRDREKYLKGEKKLSQQKITQIEKKAKQLVEMKITRLYNREMLKSVVRNTKTWAGVDVEEVVANAAVLTLKNYQKYLAGTKKLTPDDLRKIYKKATDLVDQTRKLLVKEANTLPIALATQQAVDELRNCKIAPGETPEQFKEYLMRNFYQVMGLQVAYGKWNEGTIIKGPQEGMADYQVQQVITDGHGLQIVVLYPTHVADASERPAPVFCCRGTCTIHNLFDDLSKTIGSYSFYPARPLIEESLLEAGNAYGPVVLTGHSLGGALCQLMAANFCDISAENGHSIIKEVHMYNAPGVGAEVAKEYAQKRNALAPENRPDVYHTRHVHDIVSNGGGDHIEINHRVDLGKWNLPIQPVKMLKKLLAAHTHVNSIHDFFLLKKIKKTISAGKKLTKATLEVARKIAGLLLRSIVAEMMYAQNRYFHDSDQIKRFIHSDDISSAELNAWQTLKEVVQ